MRIINGRLHGAIDYATAVALVVAPFALGLPESSVFATWFSVVAGVGLFTYSLLTDYSLGVRELIPFRVHLALDLAAAVTFLAVPLLVGFGGIARDYCFGVGLAVAIVVALTDPNAPVAESSAGAGLPAAR